MTANFGSTTNVDEESASYKSFGGLLKHEQIYYDAWNSVDLRKELGQQLIQKYSIDAGITGGLGTGGAGTAGSALIPVYVSPDIIDRARKLTPLIELIPRMAVKGK